MAPFRSGSTALAPGLAFASTVGDRLDALGSDPQAVHAELAAAERGEAGAPALPRTVLEFAARFGDDELGEILRALASRVSQIPAQGVSWGWEEDPRTEIPAGSLTIGVDFDAGFGARIAPGPVLETSGRLGVAASTKVPFQYGSVALRAGLVGEATLRLGFAGEGDPPLYETLRQRLPDVGSIGRASAFAAQESLRFFTLETFGQVRLGGTVEAGKSWRIRRGSPDDEAPRIEAVARVGGSYAVDWARAGRYRIRVERASGSLRIRLDDQETTEFTRALSLGASLRVEGLGEVVGPVLDEHAGLPDELLGMARRYARPTGLLREWIDKNVEDERVRRLLETLLSEGDAGDLAPELGRLVAEAVDARVENWTELLAGEVTGVARRALELLAPALSTELVDRAEEEVADLLEAAGEFLREEIRGTLTDLVARLGAGVAREIRKIVEVPLESLAELEAEAQRLLKPAIALIQRYREVHRRLGEAVELATHEELGLSIAREVKTSRTDQALLVFVLTPGTDRAQELYRQMLLGDFREAMRAGLDSDVGGIELEDGVFKRALQYRRTSGVTIDLFGFKASQKSILTSDVRIEYDPAGNVTVFEGEAVLRAVRRGRSASQQLRLASAIRLAHTEEDDTIVPFTARLSYQDEDLKLEELHTLLGRLEAAGLVASGTLAHATQAYDTLGVPDPDGERALHVDLVLALSSRELADLAARDAEDLLRRAVEAQVQLRKKLSARDRDLFARAAARVGPIARYAYASVEKSTHALRRDLHGLFGPGGPNVLRGRTPALDRTVGLVYRIGENAEGLVDYLQGVRGLDALATMADGALDLEAGRRVEQAHRRLVVDLEGWTGTDYPVDLFHPERLSIWTVGLLYTLRELVPSRPPLVPIVSWREEGRVRKILFVGRA